LVDANLHLWLDEKSSYASGSLIKYEAPEYVPSLDPQFRDLDGRFKASASRYISSTEWVKSSYVWHLHQSDHRFQLWHLHQASIFCIVLRTIFSRLPTVCGLWDNRPSE
ncbi:unnamed protein product, partial [Musa acuminata subsp. burmannicoides]